MMNGWPTCCDTWSNTARAMMSVAAPAVSGMITRIGRVGQFCAETGANVPAMQRTTTASKVRRIETSRCFIVGA